jgi:hypothetical protein
VEQARLIIMLALALQTRALPEPREWENTSYSPGTATDADLPHRPWWAALLWWRR